MSYFSINRNFWHLIISFCAILLYVSSCTLAVREELSVSQDILKQYVGNYQIAPNFIMVVTLEGSQLIIQAMGQPRFPVYAKSETIFAPRAFTALIEFFKDDKGEVTHLVLTQHGKKMKAPRIVKNKGVRP